MNKNRHRSLAFLSALAAILPFFAIAPFALGVTSAEDTTTTETDEEKKKREEKEKEDAAKQKAEDDKKKDEEAKAKASKPPLSACLSGALAALKGGTPALAAAALTAEQSAHTTTKATLTQAQADLTTAKASLTSTEAALASVCSFFGIKPAEVSGLTTEKVHGVLQAKISAQAVEIVAGIGIEPTRAPAPSNAEGTQSITEIQAEMAKTQDPVRLGQLAAKANALRDGKPAKPTV